MKAKRNYRKEQWLRHFEIGVVTKFPECAGKIDWNTASYLYNSGQYDLDAAVEQYCQSETIKPHK